MSKAISTVSVVNSTTNKVTVAAAPQGAGTAFAYTQSSTAALIYNTSPVNAVEYKLNSGAWIPIPHGTGPTVMCDLAVDVITLRQVDATGISTVEISVDSAPTSNIGGITAPLIIVGSTAPSNADGRPDGTLYVQTV
jgi:hypothetical protein